ncbi:MAG: type IV pilus biogenesis/stability protein PilW [Woeseia sp.]
MKTNIGILAGGAAILMLAGCISTSTSVGPTYEESGDAAVQYYELGARYFRNGSYELAKERLERALDLDPRMASAHYTLALTYEKLGNVRLATEHYKQAVRVAPSNHDARNAYAVFLCRQQKFDEAVKQFDRAANIPDNHNRFVMMTNAGACLIGKPDFARAEQYFRDALREKPNHSEALLQLAVLKHRTGYFLQARAFLQRFLWGNKASPAILYLGIQIEKELGDERAATDYMNQLLRDFPNSAEARTALAAD